MNKCSNCGAEFEGNFCPECGSPSDAPKTCPHCGAPLKPNAKFCSNCGHRFLQQDALAATVAQPAQPAPKAATGIRWQQNDILHKILLYAPLVIFVLWAVLMFAFMAAPVMSDELFDENVNVYGLFNEENTGGVDELEALVPAAAALVAVSAIAVLYAGWLALVYDGKKLTRLIGQWASILFYVIVIICTSVIAVKFNAFFDDLDDVKGPFVGITVAFTVVFMVLHIGALVACKLLSVGTLTAKERAEIRENFQNWLAKCRYYRMRRKALAPRFKSERFMTCSRIEGGMCVAIVVFFALGLVIYWVKNFFGSFSAEAKPTLINVATGFLTILMTFIAVLTCVAVYRQRWPKSIILSSIMIPFCPFVSFMYLLAVSTNKTKMDALNMIGCFVVYLIAFICSIVNLRMQVVDQRKAFGRYYREYDEQAAAEGNEIAQMLLQQSHPKKAKDDHSSQNDPK